MEQPTRNTLHNPLLHAFDAVDRRWQWCQCSTCKVVKVCTPGFDFWAKNDGDPLECERCFFAKLGAPGLAGHHLGVRKITKS